MQKASIFLMILVLLLVASCKETEARRPIARSGGTFIKESIVRNKKLLNSEEKEIDSIIKSTPEKKYFAATKGFWYTYEIRNERDTLTPQKGDIVYFDYEIHDLYNNVIYTDVELRTQIYTVDQQDILMGLRYGLKLMRKNEKVTFLFPSTMAYGYLGDKNRIGPNVPLRCTVELKEIKKN